MANTEFFRRVEEWRIANGRDPKTGARLRVNDGTPDIMQVVLAALNVAERHGRYDLQAHYKRVRSHLASQQK